MQLYMLMYGKSKKRLKPIMIDTLDKVDRYAKDLLVTAEGNGTTRWTKIVPAEKGVRAWRKDTFGPWTNYNAPGPQLVKRVK